MENKNNDELVEARHKIGLYSVKETCAMFKCGRLRVDLLLNSGQLKYICPNGHTRYFYLEDFLRLTEGRGK